MRTKKGKEYSKSGLVNIRSGLNRHLQYPPHSRSINLMRDLQFHKANKVFKGQLRTNKRAGLHKVNHTKSMEPEEIDQCYNEYFLPNMYINPQALQHKVFYELNFYMAKRGREGLRNLTRDSFNILKDHRGREYVMLAHDEATKTGQGDEEHDNDTDQDNVMYEQPNSDRCPVKSFKFYLSKLNPLQTAFFQQPVRKAVSKVSVPWYQNQAVGKNKIGGFMQEISKEAKLNTIYSNHCIRATAINALVRGKHAPTEVIAVSGHKSVEGLKPYIERPTLKERRSLNNTLSHYAAGNESDEEPNPNLKAVMPKPVNVVNEGNEAGANPMQVMPNAVNVVNGEANPMQIQANENAGQKGLIISGGNFHNCTIQLKL